MTGPRRRTQQHSSRPTRALLPGSVVNGWRTTDREKGTTDRPAPTPAPCSRNMHKQTHTHARTQTRAHRQERALTCDTEYNSRERQALHRPLSLVLGSPGSLTRSDKPPAERSLHPLLSAPWGRRRLDGIS